MSKTKKKNSTKQMIMLVVMLALFGFVGYEVYQLFFASSLSVPVQSVAPKRIVEPVKNPVHRIRTAPVTVAPTPVKPTEYGKLANALSEAKVRTLLLQQQAQAENYRVQLLKSKQLEQSMTEQTQVVSAGQHKMAIAPSKPTLNYVSNIGSGWIASLNVAGEIKRVRVGDRIGDQYQVMRIDSQGVWLKAGKTRQFLAVSE